MDRTRLGIHVVYLIYDRMSSGPLVVVFFCLSFSSVDPTITVANISSVLFRLPGTYRHTISYTSYTRNIVVVVSSAQ